jgi:tetratricopeptide (TPR) repeat protein
LRITSDESDPKRISALSQLASMPPYAHDMQRSKALSAQALELARHQGAPALLAEALRARLYALSGPDDIGALLSTAREMLAMDAGSDSWISIAAHSARYGAGIHRGDLASADEALFALGQTARKQRKPEALWYHERLVAQRRFLDGDLASGESAFAELENMRLNNSTLPFRIPQALLAIERTNAPSALATRELPELSTRAQEMSVEYSVGVARIAVAVGRVDLASPVLERLAPDGFSCIPKDISYLSTLVNLSLVAIALADHARAECLYALLSPYPQHNSPSRLMYYEGSVSHYLALLAEHLGAHERVEAHFDAALIMNEALGHKAQLARTYYEYARFLFRRHGRGRRRAQQLKTQGARLATTLGMNALASQARAL